MIVVDFFATLQAAEAAKRYSRDELVKEENVLLHTGWVACWCLFVGLALNKRKEGMVDYSLLLTKALLHDFDEIGTGDIPRITKYANVSCLEEFRNIERSAVRSLQGFLGLDIFEPWNDSKDDSIEGRIIKLADLASVVYKVWSEIILRNNYAFYRVSKELESVIDRCRAETTKGEDETFDEFVTLLLEQFSKIVTRANFICSNTEELSLIELKIGEYQ